MAQWFVVRGGEEQGPLAGQQLKEMATTRELSTTNLVRREDMKAPRQAPRRQGVVPEC